MHRTVVHVNELTEPRPTRNRVTAEPISISYHGLISNRHQSRPRTRLVPRVAAPTHNNEMSCFHAKDNLKLKLIIT
jgi:hypothetical protein